MTGITPALSDELAEICRCAQKGLGVALNFNSFDYDVEQLASILRPYRIAKECGCKFYFRSDAQHLHHLKKEKANFPNIATLLNLTENEKTPRKGVRLF